MADFEIRRSQLIAPFGPGAIVDLPGNLSVVVTGSASWVAADTRYENEQRFKIDDEQRLARRLGVRNLRWPPEYLRADPMDGNLAGICVPARRFPLWHHCNRCRRMQKLRATANELTTSCTLPNGRGRRCGGDLIPFRWVAVCPSGHLQDVPLEEWHHRHEGNCDQPPAFQYTASGGGDSLGGVRIRCENNGCTANASLSQIFMPGEDNGYTCEGHRPWLTQPDAQEKCDRNLSITLKGASEVYQPEVRPSLFIPLGATPREQLLEQLWSTHEVEIREEKAADNDEAAFGVLIRSYFRRYADQFNQHQINADQFCQFIEGKLNANVGEEEEGGEVTEEQFRRQEFIVFCEGAQRAATKDLSMRQRDADVYDWSTVCENGLIEQVVLLEKLRETRALVGFQRLPGTIETQEERERYKPRDLAVLKRLMTGNGMPDWLPACIVRGEGIFIRFNNELLSKWEAEKKVQEHFARFNARVLQEDARFRREGLNPRFVLLHTLAHLLIRRLTFNCGYGSSSLRERIYCHHDNPEQPMNAMVIYTASGDSEGSLGGLVKQGEPGYLERVFQEALEEAEWCSADPVCADLSKGGGQGPGSINGAACHNCALLPETSCETFNKYLDRKFVVDLEGDIPSLFQRH
jgi:hypothetical protein